MLLQYEQAPLHGADKDVGLPDTAKLSDARTELDYYITVGIPCKMLKLLSVTALALA